MKLRDAFWVLFISMVPLIELRGAIPVGAVMNLPFYVNFAVAVIGNLLPVLFILLFIPKILDFLERFKLFRPIVQWLHKKADKNRGKIDKAKEKITSAEMAADGSEPDLHADMENASIFNTPSGEVIPPEQKSEEKGTSAAKSRLSVGTFIALMLFVLIPAPGTGAWTGSLVASLFGFPRAKSFTAIALGVLGCGVIMCLASYGVIGFLSFLA